MRLRSSVLLAGTGALLNLALGLLAHLLGLPLYLDSIFTILVTINLGIPAGVLTAVLTNTFLAITGTVLFPFVCCSILTVLVSALFLRRGWLKTLSGYLWLGLALGLSNGVAGSLLSFWLFGGVTEVHGIDRLVVSLYVAGQSLLHAVFWAGLFTNVLDKSLSALVAFRMNPWVQGLRDKPLLTSAPVE